MWAESCCTNITCRVWCPWKWAQISLRPLLFIRYRATMAANAATATASTWGGGGGGGDGSGGGKRRSWLRGSAISNDLILGFSLFLNALDPYRIWRGFPRDLPKICPGFTWAHMEFRTWRGGSVSLTLKFSTFNVICILICLSPVDVVRMETKQQLSWLFGLCESGSLGRLEQSGNSSYLGFWYASNR